MMCIVAMKNMTAAMKGKDALTRSGISCSVVNLEPSLTSGGCAYGISLPCPYINEAIKIIKRKNIPYGEILGGG